MRDELQCALSAARQLPREELPKLLGELEEIRCIAMARLTAPAPSQPRPDEFLDVATAAARLGISEDYLYHHHREYPFTRREGRKLLFSSLGIDQYIREQDSRAVLTAKQRERILSVSHSR